MCLSMSIRKNSLPKCWSAPSAPPGKVERRCRNAPLEAWVPGCHVFTHHWSRMLAIKNREIHAQIHGKFMGYLTGMAPFAYWNPQGTLLWPAFETEMFSLRNVKPSTRYRIRNRIQGFNCLYNLALPNTPQSDDMWWLCHTENISV